MAALTLIQGDAQAEFVEHPTEIARRALMAAAEVETPRFADQLRRFAATFPARGPLVHDEARELARQSQSR